MFFLFLQYIYFQTIEFPVMSSSCLYDRCNLTLVFLSSLYSELLFLTFSLSFPLINQNVCTIPFVFTMHLFTNMYVCKYVQTIVSSSVLYGCCNNTLLLSSPYSGHQMFTFLLIRGLSSTFP